MKYAHPGSRVPSRTLLPLLGLLALGGAGLGAAEHPDGHVSAADPRMGGTVPVRFLLGCGDEGFTIVLDGLREDAPQKILILYGSDLATVGTDVVEVPAGVAEHWFPLAVPGAEPRAAALGILGEPVQAPVGCGQKL